MINIQNFSFVSPTQIVTMWKVRCKNVKHRDCNCEATITKEKEKRREQCWNIIGIPLIL
jgi:hypothetical protein